MTYRLYYRFDQFDPTFPPPRQLKELTYPLEKPGRHYGGGPGRVSGDAHNASMMLSIPPLPQTSAQLAAAAMAVAAATQHNHQQQQEEPPMDIAAIINGENSKPSAEERRKLLAEVREHLDILKEFEGAISPEELAERKRQLFLALPPAPPAAPGSHKKPRAS